MLDVARQDDFMRASPIRPKIHRPKSDRKEKSSFSVDQAKSILAAVDPFYRAALITLALTGIRAGELLGLRWFNIDFLRRRITITDSLWRGKLQTTKTEASDRTLAMSDLLVNSLIEHRGVSNFKQSGDFVFCQTDGRPTDPSFTEKQAASNWRKSNWAIPASRRLAIYTPTLMIKKWTALAAVLEKALEGFCGQSVVKTAGEPQSVQ
jgi:integrase